MSTTSQVRFRLRQNSIFTTIHAFAFYLVCLVGLGALIGLLLAPKLLFPAEDAVILFQFSKNLAHTGAITFIAHGPHAEGATDFGWMALIALGIKLGIEPVWFVAVANVVSIVVLAVLLLRLAGRRFRLLPLLFIVGAISLFPQYFAAVVGFSSLPFACLLGLLGFAYLRRSDAALALVSLVLCLFRPDGVIFAVPLLISALIVYPRRLRRFTLDVLIFVLPGLTYFVWRWHYFGELLPLPFLVKADAQRIAHLFVFDSLKAGAHYLLFCVALLLVAIRKHWRDEGNRPLLLCMILLPNIFYFAMRLDQNIGDRFFIYMPVGAAVLLAANWHVVRTQKNLIWLAAAFWVAFMQGEFRYQEGILEHYQHDNRIAIAQDLGHLPQGTMLVTEAGILPYDSRWIAYDAWGLSTADFARRLLQPSDVSRIHPDLMLVYTGGNSACFSQAGWKTPHTARTWDNLTENLVAGAEAAQYDLWLVPFGSSSYRARHAIAPHEGDQECWFLRPDSPLYASLKDVLSRHHGIPAEAYKRLHPTLQEQRPNWQSDPS